MKGLLALGAAAIVAIVVTVGQVGRDWLPALDTLPAWAGGRPDVAACERHIATTLAAPATYGRVNVEAADSASLTQAAFDRETGARPTTAPRRRKGDKLDDTLSSLDRIAAMTADLERQRAQGHDLRLRRMIVRYDAANVADVPTRSAAMCLFRLVDGRLDAEADLRRRAERSTAALDGALAHLGRKPLAIGRPSGCCLP